jgi:hypothetical protein
MRSIKLESYAQVFFVNVYSALVRAANRESMAKNGPRATLFTDAALQGKRRFIDLTQELSRSAGGFPF